MKSMTWTNHITKNHKNRQSYNTPQLRIAILKLSISGRFVCNTGWLPSVIVIDIFPQPAKSARVLHLLRKRLIATEPSLVHLSEHM